MGVVDDLKKAIKDLQDELEKSAERTRKKTIELMAKAERLEEELGEKRSGG